MKNSISKSLASADRLLPAMELVGIFLWLSNLIRTNSYFSVYCLCGMAGLFCLIDNHRKDQHLQGKAFGTGLALSICMSLAVAAANYLIFQRVRNPAEVSPGANQLMNLLECGAVILGGIPVFYEILRWFYCLTDPDRSVFRRPVSGAHPVKFYLICFGIMVLIDTVYLFFVDYPGNVSHDSLRQITQTYTGNYDNLVPYWYTRLIGLILKPGYWLFRDPNRAVAFYSFLQILAMTGIFAFVLVTLYEHRVSRLTIAAVFAIYAFVPYNIAFATSMWKDVLFTGFIVLLLTAQFRILRPMGKGWVNFLLMVLGGIGVSIMRTNGWYVMAICFVLLLICGKEIRRKLALGMAIAAGVGFFLNVPMLKLQGIAGIDKIETMSLPIQQIARVVVQERPISQEDQELLNQVVELDKIPEIYQEWTSDPIKYMASLQNPEYFLDHPREFLSLWIRLGLQYPQDYFEGWVELTKGYWNGGYDYYIYAEYVADNDYGIAMDSRMNPIKQLVKAYFALSRESILFEPVLSIGLQVWIMLGCWWLCGMRKRKETVLFIPLLVIIAGLWVGTPVFSEFRYAYPIAASLPLLVPMTLMGKKEL